jgi:H+/Cl- antiporter ClcA
VATPLNLVSVLRSRSYLGLLALAALIGVPVSAAAYGFLALVGQAQGWLFTTLPRGLGLGAEPLWWPLPLLTASGVLVALAIRYLPGTGGHAPADGFQAGGGPPSPAQLPGVVLAALAALSLGVVLGPEAPLIALGGGLGVCAVRMVRRGAPDQARVVVAGAGSFAAISALFGSPLLGAFLLMEAAGVGGDLLELLLLPGLLAAGAGSLIFIGLGAWTGLGTFSLAIRHVPHLGPPHLGEFGWALVIGAAAAVAGSGIRRLALRLRPEADRRRLLVTPVAGLAVAGLAVAYAAGTGRPSSEVLFSGQNALGPLIASSASYSVAGLVLLLACKGLAYASSLSAFRGGPVFPAMFLGAAAGLALAHLPGLAAVAGAAMGIGAMCAVMLRLPLTSVLLATLIFSADGVAVMPLVIVAVVVAYVLSARLLPAPAPPAPADAGDAGALAHGRPSARRDQRAEPGVARR